MLILSSAPQNHSAPRVMQDFQKYVPMQQQKGDKKDGDKLVTSIGLMSGTSVDGSVSAAGLTTDGEGVIKRWGTVDYLYEDPQGTSRPIHHLFKAAEKAFRKSNGDRAAAESLFPSAVADYVRDTFKISEEDARLKTTELAMDFSAGKSAQITFAELVKRSTETHIGAIEELLRHTGKSAAEIDIVGYHGQTTYHAPAKGITIQVGMPELIAEKFNVDVAYDFRSADVAAGGQGAPLAPIYHRALLLSKGESHWAVLNLGGTANLTFVSKDLNQMLGFDTGPANGLIDKFVKERTGSGYDKDSGLANGGVVHEDIVELLLEKGVRYSDGSNYLLKTPPKSLDIRDYTYDFPEFHALSVKDGCATLNAFTAACVAKGMEWLPQFGVSEPKKIVLCGGGDKNRHLVAQLEQRLKNVLKDSFTIVSADDVGLSAAGMEAELFAYLAVRTLKGTPITFPRTTGAPEPLCGGKLLKKK